MASLDLSALLPALVRIAVALEAANEIAAANCSGISAPLQPSALPAPVVDTVPGIQVSAPEGGATEPGTPLPPLPPLPVLNPVVQPAMGEREGALSRCGPDEGEGRHESNLCKLECQPSSSGRCTCSFESDYAMPTALSPRPRRRQLSPFSPFSHYRSLSPHSPAISLPQVDTQADSAPPSFWGPDSEGVHGDEDTSFIVPDAFVLYSEGSGSIAYCGI